MVFVENLPPEVLLLALLPVLRGDDPLASTTGAPEVSTTKDTNSGGFFWLRGWVMSYHMGKNRANMRWTCLTFFFLGGEEIYIYIYLNIYMHTGIYIYIYIDITCIDLVLNYRRTFTPPQMSVHQRSLASSSGCWLGSLCWWEHPANDLFRLVLNITISYDIHIYFIVAKIEIIYIYILSK